MWGHRSGARERLLRHNQAPPTQKAEGPVVRGAWLVTSLDHLVGIPAAILAHPDEGEDQHDEREEERCGN
jgi:hypothetical protein